MIQYRHLIIRRVRAWHADNGGNLISHGHPEVLVATSFRGSFPKFLTNDVGARAVGGVCGIHNSTKSQTKVLTKEFLRKDIRGQIVPHSNGLRKIEINQLNTLLYEIFVDRVRNDLVHSG